MGLGNLVPLHATTIEDIMTRTSVRAYSDRKVESEKVDTLLRAAMAVPSAGNKQPWRFVVIDDRKSVSWYLEGEQAAQRANFNVFVFGLTDSLHDSEKILYEEYGVDYVDNGWNTHELITPVTADGFMVAVSCDYYLRVGHMVYN